MLNPTLVEGFRHRPWTNLDAELSKPWIWMGYLEWYPMLAIWTSILNTATDHSNNLFPTNRTERTISTVRLALDIDS